MASVRRRVRGAAKAGGEPAGAGGAAARDSADAARAIPRRRRLVYLSIPYAVFALLLASAEVGVRLTLPRVTRFELLMEQQRTQAGFIDRERKTIFEDDPLLFWRVKPNLDRSVWDFTVVSTNSQGFRHEGDLGPKEPGAIRVVCLGDSVTFGYRVPLVRPERPDQYARDQLPYPMLLERALRAANPGRKIEVIALAVPGYTSYQGLLLLRREIDRLRPDVVTVCFGWNDVSLRDATDRETMPDGRARLLLRRLTGSSQALTHAALWLQRRRARAEEEQRRQQQQQQQQQQQSPPPTRRTTRVPEGEFAANVIEAAQLARGRGARVLVVGTVYRDAVTNPPEAARIRGHRDLLRSAAQVHGVDYIDIPELTEANHPHSKKLFGELIHPNYEGHRVFADALLKHFAARGTLPGLNVPPGL